MVIFCGVQLLLSVHYSVDKWGVPCAAIVIMHAIVYFDIIFDVLVCDCLVYFLVLLYMPCGYYIKPLFTLCVIGINIVGIFTFFGASEYSISFMDQLRMIQALRSTLSRSKT